MVKVIKRAKREKKKKKKKPVETDEQKYRHHKKKLDKLKELGLYDLYIKKDKSRLTVAQRQKIDMVLKSKSSRLLIRKYTPLEFKEKLDEYFKKKDEEIIREYIAKDGSKVAIRGAPYTMEGLRRHIGFSQPTWRKYRTDPTFEEYHEIANDAEERVVEQIVEKGLTKKYDGNFSKFYLSNISSLKEKGNSSDHPQIGNIVFVTPKDREEAQQLLEEGKTGYQGEIIDAETVEEE